jgi:hypothetical protein
LRDSYLQEFRKAASGLRGMHPRDLTTDQWWALGRHHGLVSPLLDWTEKPYIATFFALAEHYYNIAPTHGPMYPQGSVAIYRLVHNRDLENQCLKVIHVSLDELPHIQGQHGLFTWLDSEKYFELQGFLDDTGKGNNLTKIVLTHDALFEGMNDLDMAGIDYRLLFPDIQGAAKHANDVRRRHAAYILGGT